MSDEKSNDLEDPRKDSVSEEEAALDGDDNAPPDSLSETAPFNPARIDIITQNRTIDSLLSRLKYGELDLSPDFQRNANLWDNARKTSLIESILLRIPLPSLYVSEDKEGNYAVVDGLQRLSAIAHFTDVEALNEALGTDLDALKLEEKGLRSFKELAGKTFNKLERPLQRRIRETELTVHVIRSGTPGAVKFNIFSRINQGGLPLKAQEIRNAIFPSGLWRKKIRELAESQDFLTATEGKIPLKRMENMELVLRAVALHYHRELRPNDQNLEDYLNQFVEDECQHWDEQKWQKVQIHIKNALIVAPAIFGEHVFRKYYREGEKRKPINVGLFEAEVGLLSRYEKADLLILLNRADEVKNQFVRISGGKSNESTQGDNNISSFIGQSEEASFDLIDMDFDFDNVDAWWALNTGTTTATSKGLASNQRVRAIQYIFDQVLNNEKGNTDA
jgi:hypothetical protein